MGKVPPQFIHHLERLPHVGRVDSDDPLVLLIIPSLNRGLGAQLEAVNRKRVGGEREDHMLVNPFTQLPQLCAFVHPPEASLSACLLHHRPRMERKCIGSAIPAGPSSAKYIPLVEAGSSLSYHQHLYNFGKILILHPPCPKGVEETEGD